MKILYGLLGVSILIIIAGGIFFYTTKNPFSQKEEISPSSLVENDISQAEATPSPLTSAPSNIPQQKDALPYTYSITKEVAQYDQTCKEDTAYQGVARIEIKLTSEEEALVTHGGIHIQDTQGTPVGFLGDSSMPRMYIIDPNKTTTLSFSYVFNILEVPDVYTVTFLPPYIRVQETSLPLYEWNPTIQEIQVPTCNN